MSSMENSICRSRMMMRALSILFLVIEAISGGFIHRGRNENSLLVVKPKRLCGQTVICENAPMLYEVSFSITFTPSIRGSQAAFSRPLR